MKICFRVGCLVLLLLRLGLSFAQSEVTPDAESLEDAVARAINFDGAVNADWQMYRHVFEDGIEMALVPTGCFMLGMSDELLAHEMEELDLDASYFTELQPAHEICIETPFWIDVNEVAQADFIRLDGLMEAAQLNTLTDYPVVEITWYEAAAFCELRGGRLPSEAEWEYAARGVESLSYPWGNEFEPNRLNYCDDSCESGTRDVNFDDGYAQSAPVQTYPENVSWIGAYDLLGNVWEWTNSMYLGYPYDASDGREYFPEAESIIEQARVIRGIGWNGALSRRTASTRLYRDATESLDFLGMRCVRDID